MSARAAPPIDHRLDRPSDGSWVLAPAALLLLLARPWYASTPAGRPLLAMVYAAIGIAAAMAATPATRSRWVRPGVPFGVGLSAVLVAGAIGRPALHVSAGPEAMALTALASVAEEAFFRGFLYERLARFGSAMAVLASAGAFALIHVPAYPAPAVAIDLAAGVLLGWQRWASGTWLVPAGTHLAANLLVVMR